MAAFYPFNQSDTGTRPTEPSWVDLGDDDITIYPVGEPWPDEVIAMKPTKYKGPERHTGKGKSKKY